MTGTYLCHHGKCFTLERTWVFPLWPCIDQRAIITLLSCLFWIVFHTLLVSAEWNMASLLEATQGTSAGSSLFKGSAAEAHDSPEWPRLQTVHGQRWESFVQRLILFSTWTEKHLHPIKCTCLSTGTDLFNGQHTWLWGRRLCDSFCISSVSFIQYQLDGSGADVIAALTYY